MRLSLRILIQLAWNALAFSLAITFLHGFHISPPLPLHLTIVVLLFTLLNILLKPLFKILFGPLILITFGVLLFAINIILLLILDYLSASVTIQGLLALFGGAVLVSVCNLGTSILTRILHIRR